MRHTAFCLKNRVILGEKCKSCQLSVFGFFVPRAESFFGMKNDWYLRNFSDCKAKYLLNDFK